MGAIWTKRCPNGHRWEVLEHAGVETSLARDGEACWDPTCPDCGEEGQRVYEFGGQTPHGAGYPYFDFGLGVRVTSAQHKREVMRKLGWAELEGEMDRHTQGILDDMNAKDRKLTEDYEKMMSEYRADPETRRTLAELPTAGGSKALDIKTGRELAAKWGAR